MDEKASWAKLNSSKVFSDWHGAHDNSYLCSLFAIEDTTGNGFEKPKTWSIDFYNPDDETMTSFSVNDDEVKIQEEGSKFFSKKGTKIEQIDLEKVKLFFDDMIKIVKEFVLKNHKSERMMKRIFILQKIGQPLWNATFIMESMNILNIKIDAKSGEILENKFDHIMTMRV